MKLEAFKWYVAAGPRDVVAPDSAVRLKTLGLAVLLTVSTYGADMIS